MKLRNILTVAIALAGVVAPAAAEENAIGRSLPGAWVMPQGGVVPTTPGCSVTIMPIGYIGKIGGGREVGVNGALVANVHANFISNFLVLQCVYKTEATKVSFSSTVYEPFNWVSSSGSLQLIGQRVDLTRNHTDTSGGLSDLFFSPLTIGIHFSDVNNLAIDAKIFAPTGSFKVGDLSNLGMGEWTFMPNFAHTYLWPKRGLELDNYVGFDIYTKNSANNYTSGTMFHWDGMLIQYLSKTLGFGVIASNLTQITKDTGPIATQLNGFQGRAWGAGPMVLYVIKPGKPGVTFQFRWVPEFSVTNMVKGNTLLMGFTFML